jgi:hypothetical protein
MLFGTLYPCPDIPLDLLERLQELLPVIAHEKVQAVEAAEGKQLPEVKLMTIWAGGPKMIRFRLSVWDVAFKGYEPQIAAAIQTDERVMRLFDDWARASFEVTVNAVEGGDYSISTLDLG